MSDLQRTIKYIYYNAHGDAQRVEDRVIHKKIKSVDGREIIIWSPVEKPHLVGGCLPSTWREWASGINERRRRGTTVWSSGPRPDPHNEKTCGVCMEKNE